MAWSDGMGVESPVRPLPVVGSGLAGPLSASLMSKHYCKLLRMASYQACRPRFGCTWSAR